ncbi:MULTISPECIES: hypothetical protein [Thioclava]|uniref:hypothetical protein n=1 Tax=Thioclava TaxID=285107 RepID=UPI000B543CDD|nr:MULTISPECIES: hypothetical protein [Thioclava]OWY01500.1 hypothetical protein B6V76_14560 [Thioclava sp. IC9]WGT49630.1 hypothetical protein P0N61_15120 [Thioclava nitratireducens]
MKYGWRLLFIPLWVLCIAGAVVTAFLAFDWMNWQAFVVAGLIGLLVGVPAGLWNTFKVRREDPDWKRSPSRSGVT